MGPGWWMMLVATAGPADCRPADAEAFCARAAFEKNVITQSDIDLGTTALFEGAWVIDGSTTVSLPPGGYSPGISETALERAIWVLDDATLEIVGSGDDEVSIDASIYLCDDASLVIRDSLVRLPPRQGRTLRWVAAGRSHVRVEDAVLQATSPGGLPEELDLVMRASSELTALRTTVDEGPWRLTATDSATALVEDVTAQGIYTVAAGGDISVTRGSPFTMVVDPCAQPVTLADLPPARAGTVYERPSAPFLSITDSSVSSWVLETQPGADVTLSGIDPKALLLMSLQGLPSGRYVLPEGDPEGLTDRSVRIGEEPFRGWDVDLDGVVDVTVGPGSVLETLTVGAGGTTCTLDGAQVRGDVDVPGGTLVVLDSRVDGVVDARQGLLQSRMSRFDDVVRLIDSTAYHADLQAPINTYIDGGELHVLSMSAPVGGTELVVGDALVVSGDVMAGLGEEAWEGTVEVRVLGSGRVVDSVDIADRGAVSGILAVFETSGWVAQGYEVRLSFAAGGESYAARRVDLVDPPEPTVPSDPPVPSGGADAAGCGCASGELPGAWWVGMVGLMVLRRRLAAP